MYNADGEFVREVKEEKSEDELAELLSGYQVKKYPWWRVVLSVMTVAAVVLMVKGFVEFGENRTKAMLNVMSPMDVMLEEEAIENSAEKQFNSEPTHKGYFMQYVLEAYRNDELSSEEILKMAEEIDPKNALYNYLAAGENVKKIVERVRPLSSDSLSEKEKFNRVTEYKIIDEEAYAIALHQLKEAGKKSGITNHTIEILLEKLKNGKNQHPQDFIGRSVTIAEAFGASFYSIKLLDASALMSAKFYELSKKGTEKEVRLWKEEYLKLLETLLDSDGSLVDMLVAKATMLASLPNMRAAAAHAGMDAEVEKITKLIDVLFLEKEAAQKKRALRRNKWINEKGYSKLSYLNELAEMPTYLYLPSQVEWKLKIDPTPNRLADHAFAGRVLVSISFIFIGVLCIGMWIFYGSKTKSMRVMSHKVLSSLTLPDGFLIVCGGVIFPVISYVLVNEKTTLGVREWSIISAGGALILGQFLGMLLTVFTLSSFLLRWRLSKSLPEIMKSVCWYHWALPCSAFLAMLLVGFSDSKEEIIPWSIAVILLSLVALAWVGLSISSCFVKSDQLVKLSLCRGLLPLYAVTITLMIGLKYYYHSQEFKYVAQDESFAFKEEHLGMSLLEYRVAKEIRQDLLKQLEHIK